METKLKRPISFLLALVVAMVFNFPIGITSGIKGIFDFGIPAKAEAETITPTKPTTGNGSPSNPYQIGTKAELYWFAGLVNGTLTDDTAQNIAACAKLTANITVNNSVINENGELNNGSFTSWTPIGNNSTNNYTGEFDGAGYTISGLYFNNSKQNYVGLFGDLGTNGKIKNVGVIGSYFNGQQYVGGVCGYNKTDGTIENCYNKGIVSGDSRVGGVCGENYSTIKYCYNTGAVTGTATNTNVGGVCGNNTGTITSCYNTGAVTGKNFVGGVCGYNPGTVTSCYNTGAVTGTVTGTGSCVGGVIGCNPNNIITSCYYNSEDIETAIGQDYTSGTAASKNCIGKDTTAFTSGEVCYLLNGSTSTGDLVWGQTLDNENPSENDASPVFYNGKNTVYYGYTTCDEKVPMQYANNELNSTRPAHNYTNNNGFCIICDSYQPAAANNGVYEISNAGQLYWFAGLVNGDTSVCDYDADTDTGTKQNKAACAKLTANITVNSNLLSSLTYKETGFVLNSSDFTKWPCIGNYETAYTGTFDGGGHTISGLFVNNSGTGNVGLFGWVGEGGNIRNVGVLDSYFCAFQNVGGVCGKNVGGTITSCYSTSKIYGTGSEVGGVCGYNNGGTITDCYNKGEVIDIYQYNAANVGGVIGKNEGNSTIKNCYNEGTVNSVKYNVGGVFGYVCEDRVTITIENCYNTGAVTGEYNVGGVFGYVYHYKGGNVDIPNKIINCYNTGAVTSTTETATANVGGVCGYVKAHTNSGYSNAENTIENCYSTGAVTAVTTANPANIGGVCGYVEAVAGKDTDAATNTITNCYYIDDSIEAIGTASTSGSGTGTNSTDKVDKKTQDAFASGEVCYLLNGSTSEGENLVWGQTLDKENENENDVSPVFHNSENTVYYGYKTCGASDPMQYANRELSTTTRPAHDYTDNNGFCNVCGSYEPITETDGSYAISNAGQLYWFAALVNGNTSVDGITGAVPNAKATLTADITVNGSKENPLLRSLTIDNKTGEVINGENFTAWTPIGSETNKYTGTFDGDGHTISGLYFDNKDTDYVGLFGGIGTNGSVKKINIADSYFNGKNNVGGVCGYNNWGTIENCSNSGTVSGSDYVGGVCGSNSNTIKNCYNTGAVTGTGYYYVGGVCGFNGSTITNCYNTGAVTSSSCYYVGGVCGNNSGGTIESCYSTGKVTGKDYVGGVCGRNKNNTITGTITYSYYNSETCGTVTSAVGDSEDPETVTGKVTKAFESGEVCYLLNKSMSVGNLAWGQNLSGDNKDNLPVLDNSNTKIVYQYCNKGINYANTQETSIHSYDENGICACGGYQKPAAYSTDTGYQIANAGNLYWFANYVNGTLPDDANTHTSASARLIRDITVNKNVLAANGTLNEGSFRTWTPIGNSSTQYTGTFDGNGHTISGLYFDNKNQSYVGLIGYMKKGGKVEKVNIIDSYFNGNQNIGGVCGYNTGVIERCTVKSTISGYSKVGGVCGNNGDSVLETSPTIKYCYNTGAVTGKNDSGVVGGICGSNTAGSITYCYNTGTVTGTGSYVGGVIGSNGSGTITYCYYDNTVYTGGRAIGNVDNTDNVTGKDRTAFTGGEVCYLLNGSTSESSEGENLVWGQTLSGETIDASPVFHNGSNTIYLTTGCQVYANTPTKDHVIGSDGFCKDCKKELVLFSASSSKVIGWAKDVYEVNNDGSIDNSTTKKVNLADGTSLITCTFNHDESITNVVYYTIEITQGKNLVAETGMSVYNKMLGDLQANIDMAQIAYMLDDGEYTATFKLYDGDQTKLYTKTMNFSVADAVEGGIEASPGGENNSESTESTGGENNAESAA